MPWRSDIIYCPIGGVTWCSKVVPWIFDVAPKQGCTWTHLCPCERPRTRYIGVSPLQAFGVRLKQFGLRGESIAAFSDFRERSARKGAESTALENFEDFKDFQPNYCTKNALKLHFKAVSDEHFSYVRTFKNLIFLPKSSKSTFQRPDAHFWA